MQRAASYILSVLVLALPCAAQLQRNSATVDVRYSALLSNAGPGSCGCFDLKGGAADFNWNFLGIGPDRVGIAVDVGSEHTGSVNGASFGLTLTTLTAGPRIVLRGYRLEPFAQALFGIAHGSGSAFPSGANLVDSANSFALNAGGGADYRLNRLLFLRLLQVDYLRTSLPNLSSNWQNNLRIAAGITMHLNH